MPITRKYAGPYEYFSHKVRIGKPDECWEWKDSTRGHGYGQWYQLMEGLSKSGNAHRRAYILFNGDPADKSVLHRCGNSRCCNPNHLYLGDQKQNMKDCKEHGTFNPTPFKKGVNHPNSKLTESEVKQIRKLLEEQEPIRKIASKFKVSKNTICRIKSKQSWSWLQ